MTCKTKDPGREHEQYGSFLWDVDWNVAEFFEKGKETYRVDEMILGGGGWRKEACLKCQCPAENKGSYCKSRDSGKDKGRGWPENGHGMLGNQQLSGCDWSIDHPNEDALLSVPFLDFLSFFIPSLLFYNNINKHVPSSFIHSFKHLMLYCNKEMKTAACHHTHITFYNIKRKFPQMPFGGTFRTNLNSQNSCFGPFATIQETLFFLNKLLKEK